MLPVFERGTPAFGRLITGIRLLVIAEVAQAGIDLMHTMVFARDADEPYVASLFEAVETNGGQVCPVRLTAPLHVLESRIDAADRVARNKLVTVDGLRDMNATRELWKEVPGRASLLIDTTDQTPAKAARLIAKHYRLATHV
ncbi:MAG TPA: hypothetical protein VFS62_11255 [Chloroflexota bacterium]|nr:hypothetical protein [Chloroflexota bacterium]